MKSREFGPREIVDINEQKKEFEPELFRDACERLSSEYNEASEDGKRDILISRFIDCASLLICDWKNRTKKETDFFERFSMRPMWIDIYSARRYEYAKVMRYRESLLHYEVVGLKQGTDSKGLVYGPSNIFMLEPNEMIEVDMKEQDIVVTAKLTGCSVLVLKNGKTTTVVHITTPQEVLEASQKIVDMATKTGGQVTLITPEFIPDPNSDIAIADAKIFTDDRDTIVRKLEQEVSKFENVSLQIGGYPYIRYDSVRDRRVFETAVIVGKDFCETIGYNWKINNDDKKELTFFPDTRHLEE